MTADSCLPVGRWCWPELATTDLDAARAFYSPLLGWSAFDVPTAGGTYTIFRIDGKDCGAAYRMSPEQQERKLRVQWRNYVKVASADAVAARAKELGGTVVAGPFDVEGVGRMASLQDPAGVSFAVWQDGTHTGLAVQDVAGAHCWAELATRDPAGARRFYGQLFDWGTKEQDMGGFTYVVFTQADAERGVGGLMAMEGAMWDGVPDHFLQYFLVDSCEAAATRAKELGGNVCVPPTDIPTVGRFAVLGDPQGGTFAVLQPAMP